MKTATVIESNAFMNASELESEVRSFGVQISLWAYQNVKDMVGDFGLLHVL